mgnify:CR=1 FL=1
MRIFCKGLLVLGITLTLFGTSLSFVQAEEKDAKESTFKDVKLTDTQMEELDVIYQDIVNLRIGLINKYVEYGVIEKEKGEKMIQHVEGFYEKVKSNGFIPKWDKHKHKHKHDKE